MTDTQKALEVLDRLDEFAETLAEGRCMAEIKHTIRAALSQQEVDVGEDAIEKRAQKVKDALLSCCRGRPAKINWPHREMHDAAKLIDDLLKIATGRIASKDKIVIDRAELEGMKEPDTAIRLTNYLKGFGDGRNALINALIAAKTEG